MPAVGLLCPGHLVSGKYTHWGGEQPRCLTQCWERGGNSPKTRAVLVSVFEVRPGAWAMGVLSETHLLTGPSLCDAALFCSECHPPHCLASPAHPSLPNRAHLQRCCGVCSVMASCDPRPPPSQPSL